MRISCIYFFSVLFFFSGALLPVQAQNLTKVGKGVITAVEKGVPASGAKIAVPPPTLPKVTVPPAGVNMPALTPMPKYNNWVTSHKKMLFSIQRAVGISAMKAGRNLQKWGAAPSIRPPLPTPLGEPFFAKEISTLIPESQIGRGEMPVTENPQLIYRGMALDAAALHNVLEHGMLLKDVSHESTTLRLAYASKTMHPATMDKVASTPVNNFTKYPISAANWASQRLGENETVVLVSIKSYEKGAVIIETRDILPEEFYDVLAVLEVNGNPTWCKVELAENGYKITPYTSK